LQANIWQLRFHAPPSVLKDVRLDLDTDEDILRHQITRSRDVPRVKQWRVVHHYAKKFDIQTLFETKQSPGVPRIIEDKTLAPEKIETSMQDGRQTSAGDSGSHSVPRLDEQQRLG
jgi:hypothetical protein